MQHSQSPQDQAPQTLMQRLDRLAGDMNGYLLVFAIGLAILDFTCFVAFEATDIVRPALQAQMAQAAAQETPSLGNPIGR